MTFRDRLADWQDFDVAEYALAEALGIIPAGKWDYDSPIPYKSIFWSADVIGDMLGEMLNALVEVDVLKKNDDCQYKWNARFKGLDDRG